MKVLVFGAMGKTGKLVVERAAAAGHDVTAFVRDPRQATELKVRLAQGDGTNRATVAAVIRGQDAVVDTIGGKTPWRQTSLERGAAASIVEAMQDHAVRRLITTSMLGVGESRKQSPFLLRILLATYLRGANVDKSAMESIVSSTKLDWTILRPAVLTDKPSAGRVRVFATDSDEKAQRITRIDLAEFIVGQITDKMHFHKKLAISNA